MMHRVKGDDFIGEVPLWRYLWWRMTKRFIAVVENTRSLVKQNL